MISLIAGFGLDRIRSKLGFHLVNDNPLFGPLCWVAAPVATTVINAGRTPKLVGTTAGSAGAVSASVPTTRIVVGTTSLAPATAAPVATSAASVGVSGTGPGYSDTPIGTEEKKGDDC